MYRHPSRARSGPHSIHDARQYAWSLLILGPGAPAPRQRVHAGLLPDVYVAPARHRSLFSRVIAFFRRKAEEGIADREDGHAPQGSPDTETSPWPGKDDTSNTDRRAA